MLVIFVESTQIIFLLLFQFHHCFHIFYITYVHCLWSQKCNTESDRPTSGKTVFLVRKHKTLQHKAKWRKMSQEGLNISFFLRAALFPFAPKQVIEFVTGQIHVSNLYWHLFLEVRYLFKSFIILSQGSIHFLFHWDNFCIFTVIFMFGFSFFWEPVEENVNIFS